MTTRRKTMPYLEMPTSIPGPAKYKPPTAAQIAAEQKRRLAEYEKEFKEETRRQGERVNYLLDTCMKHPLVKQLIALKQSK